LNLKGEYYFRGKGLVRTGERKGWLFFKVLIFLDSFANIAMLVLVQGTAADNRKQTLTADIGARASVCISCGCFSSVIGIVSLVHHEITLIYENI